MNFLTNLKRFKIQFGLFVVLSVATVLVSYQTYVMNQDLEVYSEREFQLKLNIRAATQMRFLLAQTEWRALQILELPVGAPLAQHKIEGLYSPIESALAQLDNGFPPESQAEVKSELLKVYESVEQIASSDRRAKSQETVLNLVLVKSRELQKKAVELENEIVKNVAYEFSEIAKVRKINAIYYYAWSLVAFLAFVIALAQFYFLDRAYLKITEVRDQLDQEKIRRFQLEKTALLGEMAAGIAHEINNPLSIIVGYITKMKRLVVGSAHEKELLEIGQKTEKTAMRISKIINGLLHYARDSQRDPFVPVEVGSIIQDTLQLAQYKLDKNAVTLSIENHAGDVQVLCRSAEITQVLLNLLNNAVDAIAELDEKWIKIVLRNDQEHLQILVVDSGRGISPEIQQKIFNPFFTSKEVGKGVGLGLSIAQGIIENHHGRLSLLNSSENTTFLIELPRYDQKLQSALV